MGTQDHEKRLKIIRKGLLRGDKRIIAERANVSWVWVSYVIAGSGTSERILQIAEELIRERENIKRSPAASGNPESGRGKKKS